MELNNQELNERSEKVNAEFEDFIKELEQDEKNENANCSLDGEDCEACGS